MAKLPAKQTSLPLLGKARRSLVLFFFREEKAVVLYRRLIQFSRPYAKLLAGALACMLLLGGFTTLQVMVARQVLGDVLIRKDETQLFLLPIAIIILFFLKGLADFGQKFLLRRVGQEVVRDVRTALFTHIERLPVPFFQRNKTGGIMSRVMSDVQMVEAGLTTVISDFIKEPFTILGLCGAIFYINWQLAALAFLLLPITIAPIGQISQRLRRASKITQEMMAELSSVLQETISGIFIVKAYGGEEFEARKFESANRQYLKQSLRAVRAAASSGPIMEFLGAIVAGILIYIGGKNVISGNIPAEDLITFVGVLFMMYAPFKKVGRINHDIQRAVTAAERIFEILDLAPEVVEEKGLAELAPLSHEITFENLTFRYSENASPAVEDINLRVRKGENVALVGSSGAGKSTLVALIPRFYEVREGRIAFDGMDTRQVTLASLRAQIGMVSQEVILFNDSVLANIAYGAPNPDRERAIEAAKAAFAHEFILELPHHYDTFIGERGTTLSGGQRQRLSIARAIYKDPAILIFDEATSALDNESEKMVQKAIDNLIRNRTTFVIAHRLSTIRNVDRILVMEEGRIVEEGSHEELLAQGKVYKYLYDLQFAEV